MSHGGLHDSKGVKGTYRQGTIPDAKVLDAIPESAGTVGNLPETVLPGNADAPPPDRAQTQVRPGKIRMDEGVPVIPGGNRDRRPGTMRPQLEEQVIERTSSGQVPAEAAPVPEPEPAPVVEVVEPVPPPPPPAQDELEAAPPAPEPEAQAEVAEEPSVAPLAPPTAPMPDSRRKLRRARMSQLKAWCSQAGLSPEDYVDTPEQVTRDLMRELLAEHLNLE